MRYRQLDTRGDYTFGSGVTRFLANSPECVAQAVLTRLRLWTDEWFLDKTEGTPYMTQVLGVRTQSSRDTAIKNRILNTQGVTAITDYASQYNPADRSFKVQATISTQYGSTPITVTL